MCNSHGLFLPMTYHVNVRTIAETYYEGGDLLPAAGALDRMQEGLKGHLLIQNTYDESCRAEVPVKLVREVYGLSLCVQGRVDGLMLQGDVCVVEEIKTTSIPPHAVRENDHPVHWAQAEIYGYIEAELNGLSSVTVRLVYADFGGSRVQFSRVYLASRLKELFFLYAGEYVRRLKRAEAWQERSLPSVREGAFPFDSFRSGQREMAAAVYRSIRDKTRLLVQAPTGIGKTAAALFPAVKALGEGLTDIVFYLTARSTGRLAAEQALKLMRARGLCVRSVSVTAKAKICPMPQPVCDPETCPRARGHFDRQKLAVEASWSESALDESAVRRLAEEYRVCPFELSLALCETAQIVICDYNYVFDPKVRLRRFFDRSGRYTLLIDEAHNLPDRMRGMYSASVSGSRLSALRREVGKADGKKNSLYESLSLLLKEIGRSREYEMRSELPLPAVNAAKQFMDAAKEYLSLSRVYAKELSEAYLDAASFVRVSGDYDEDCYRTLITPSGSRPDMLLWCWDPTPRFKRAVKRMRGTVMFSATLSPLEHYGKLLAVEESEGGRLLDLPSPFPRENLLSLCLDIPVRYRMRQESAPRVARAIAAMAKARRGNYLACFPSHEYLNLVAGFLAAQDADIDILVQQRDMNERRREAFLARFEEAPARSLVAFAAMGGVFSEGVDLPGDRLIGAVIVGVGMPQICFERDQMRLLYDDEDGEGGFETAYMYPGIGKCLQAAGRVIRTSSDQGAVLFIDERYRLEEYRRLLPDHIRPAPVSEEKLPAALKKFWERG